MKNSLSWARALQVPDVRLTTDECAAGWPEAFTPENLVCLQYPWEGSTEEKKGARRNQVTLLDLMKKAMSAGSLPTVERTRTVKVTKMVPDTWVSLNAPHSQLGSPEWRLRDFGRGMGDSGPRMREVPDGERAVTIRMVEARVFLAWLLECGDKPSPHIAAWRDAAVGAAPLLKTKKPTKQALFLSLLEQIEEAWRNSGRGEIDRKEWPGRSKGLWVLAGCLMPEAFGSMAQEGFYENYAKKAGLRFGGEDGVAAIYAELFPAGRTALRGAEAA